MKKILYCIVVIACLVAVSLNVAWSHPYDYTAVRIGDLEGGLWTQIRDMNDQSVVVGDVDVLNPELGWGVSRAAVWDSANGTRRLYDANAQSSSVCAVNNSGQMLGMIDNRPVVWQDENNFTEISGLPEGNVAVYSMNDSGQVLGSYADTSSDSYSMFVWDSANGFRDLGIPTDCVSSQPIAINNVGQIIVNGVNSDGNRIPYFWDPVSGYHLISASGPGIWRMGGVTGLNDNGVVACTVLPINPWPQAYTWSLLTGISSLGAADGSVWSSVLAINNAGQVIGDLDSNPQHRSFLWSDGTGMVPIDNAGYTLINNPGQIAGWEQYADGTYSYVLWTPVPEPASILALVCGVTGLMIFRRR